LNPNPNNIRECYRCIECGSVILKETSGWSEVYKDAETREVFFTQDITPEYING
jgi:hypothetical protein